MVCPWKADWQWKCGRGKGQTEGGTRFGLTVQIQHEAALLRFHQQRVGGLAGEDGVQVGALDRRPQQPVLDDVARIVLVLLVHQDAVDEPLHRRLRAT